MSKKLVVAEEVTETETGGEEVVEAAVEDTAATELAKEREKIALEREELEAEKQRVREGQEKPRVTSAQLRNLDEAQRENLETQTGMKFNDIMRNVEAQETSIAENRRMATDARLNVADAIAEAVEKDPQLSKIKGGIRDYLSDFPDSAKADPVRLKKLMAKAVTYAKGAAPEKTFTRKPGATKKADGGPEGDTNDDGDLDPKAGKIKDGVYQVGDMKLEIKALISKDKRVKMTHPEHATGIRIPGDLDEAPRFR